MAFWLTKKLHEMTQDEWESLCDGCGKCCMVKLEDDSGEVHWTNVACDLLDLANCRCTRYAERTKLVANCIDLRQHDFAQDDWLPRTCAYRLLANGEPLPSWHPLVSGKADSVRKAGVCISSYAISESQAQDPTQHIIHWQP